ILTLHQRVERQRELLRARGLPEDCVYEETTSRNTRENLEVALSIMQKYGGHRAIIGTHDFHLLRAMRAEQS
ncbi:MAG: YdcF family protein, partial [Moorellaceae bacterium]